LVDDARRLAEDLRRRGWPDAEIRWKVQARAEAMAANVNVAVQAALDDVLGLP
jgi:hypothetical protein